jgi:hypothetical protein
MNLRTMTNKSTLSWLRNVSTTASGSSAMSDLLGFFPLKHGSASLHDFDGDGLRIRDVRG